MTMHTRKKRFAIMGGAVLLAACLLLIGILWRADTTSVEERWGIKIEGLRLSAAGYMLDFRYRVLDAHKARAVLDPRARPYLIDEATGAKFMVPAPPKIGALRQTSRNRPPVEGKIYFAMFANPGRYLQQGSLVTVVIGEFRAAHVQVQ